MLFSAAGAQQGASLPVSHCSHVIARCVVIGFFPRRGLHVVGEVAVGMTIFTLLPFVALCLLGECVRGLLLLC